jgi:hypothetical protein
MIGAAGVTCASLPIKLTICGPESLQEVSAQLHPTLLHLGMLGLSLLDDLICANGFSTRTARLVCKFSLLGQTLFVDLLVFYVICTCQTVSPATISNLFFKENTQVQGCL